MTHALVKTGTEAPGASGSEESWELEGTEQETLARETERWEMKKLKPLHKMVASLLAQGKKNVDVARLCGITPEYVYVLSRTRQVQEYIYEATAVAGLQLEATYPLVVQTIQETLVSGTEAGKLKAARLHLEATKRIGRVESALRPTEDMIAGLEKLSERLLALQTRAETVRAPAPLTQDGEEITDV